MRSRKGRYIRIGVGVLIAVAILKWPHAPNPVPDWSLKHGTATSHVPAAAPTDPPSAKPLQASAGNFYVAPPAEVNMKFGYLIRHFESVYQGANYADMFNSRPDQLKGDVTEKFLTSYRREVFVKMTSLSFQKLVQNKLDIVCTVPSYQSIVDVGSTDTTVKNFLVTYQVTEKGPFITTPVTFTMQSNVTLNLTAVGWRVSSEFQPESGGGASE